MNPQTHLIASVGLAIGAIFGLSGMFFTEPDIQHTLFIISGVGLTMGLALLAMKFLRIGNELTALGFLLFAIGEAILTLNTSADPQTAAASFAGCMLFYVTGHLFISLTSSFAPWVRALGGLSAIFFLIAATRFYLGYGITFNDTLPGIGYGLLSLTIFGWIYSLMSERRQLVVDK